MIVTVMCQESTRTQGITLKANETETKTESARCHAVLKLDTRLTLTVSGVVAVASVYGLVTISIALDSVLLEFGNAVILLMFLFILFGWKELLEEFEKKRSAAAAR